MSTHRACRRATWLLSVQHERSLSRWERVSLSGHLMICRACRCFGRQVRVLHALLADERVGRLPESFLDAVLSDTARERIRAALRAGESPREPDPDD